MSTSSRLTERKFLANSNDNESGEDTIEEVVVDQGVLDDYTYFFEGDEDSTGKENLNMLILDLTRKREAGSLDFVRKVDIQHVTMLDVGLISKFASSMQEICELKLVNCLLTELECSIIAES